MVVAKTYNFEFRSSIWINLIPRLPRKAQCEVRAGGSTNLDGRFPGKQYYYTHGDTVHSEDFGSQMGRTFVKATAIYGTHWDIAHLEYPSSQMGSKCVKATLNSYHMNWNLITWTLELLSELKRTEKELYVSNETLSVFIKKT